MGFPTFVTPAKAGVQSDSRVPEMGRTRTGFLAGASPLVVRLSNPPAIGRYLSTRRYALHGPTASPYAFASTRET